MASTSGRPAARCSANRSLAKGWIMPRQHLGRLGGRGLDGRPRAGPWRAWRAWRARAIDGSVSPTVLKSPVEQALPGQGPADDPGLAQRLGSAPVRWRPASSVRSRSKNAAPSAMRRTVLLDGTVGSREHGRPKTGKAPVGGTGASQPTSFGDWGNRVAKLNVERNLGGGPHRSRESMHESRPSRNSLLLIGTIAASDGLRSAAPRHGPPTTRRPRGHRRPPDLLRGRESPVHGAVERLGPRRPAGAGARA